MKHSKRQRRDAFVAELMSGLPGWQEMRERNYQPRDVLRRHYVSRPPVPILDMAIHAGIGLEKMIGSTILRFADGKPIISYSPHLALPDVRYQVAAQLGYLIRSPNLEDNIIAHLDQTHARFARELLVLPMAFERSWQGKVTLTKLAGYFNVPEHVIADRFQDVFNSFY